MPEDLFRPQLGEPHHYAYVVEFRADLAERGVPNPTARKVLFVLQSIMRLAALRGAIAHNPVKAIPKPAKLVGGSSAVTMSRSAGEDPGGGVVGPVAHVRGVARERQPVLGSPEHSAKFGTRLASATR